MEIQSRPELAFDEQQHLYTLGGFVLPSVTQIMSPMSSMLYAAVPQAVLDGRRTEERGRMNRSATMSGMVCLKRMKTLRHTSERFSAFAKIIRQLGRAARFAPIIDR